MGHYQKIEGINYTLYVENDEVVSLIGVSREVASYTKEWEFSLKRYEDKYGERNLSEITVVRISGYPDLIMIGDVKNYERLLYRKARSEEDDWITLKDPTGEKDVFVLRHDVEFAKPSQFSKNKEIVKCVQIQMLSGRSLNVHEDSINELKLFNNNLKRKRKN